MFRKIKGISKPYQITLVDKATICNHIPFIRSPRLHLLYTSPLCIIIPYSKTKLGVNNIASNIMVANFLVATPRQNSETLFIPADDHPQGSHHLAFWTL
jgi:hypothetical protein